MITEGWMDVDDTVIRVMVRVVRVSTSGRAKVSEPRGDASAYSASTTFRKPLP